MAIAKERYGFMKKKGPKIARVVLGLIFLIFGLNGFLQFLPQPPMPEGATAFIMALFSSKLLMVVKSLEVLGGLALLSGYYVPLALALLAPIVFNIVWFHAILAPEGLPVAIVILVLEIYLVRVYKPVFGPIFKAK